MRIKKGDTVFVRSGQYKGQRGRVLFVNTEKNTLLVEGINKKKRHQRPTQRNPKGGVVSKEAPIHISNVALWDNSLGGPTRIGVKVIEEDGVKRRVRISAKTGEDI